MTPDIDRLQTILAWAGGVAVVVGGTIGAIIKIIKGGGEETDRERDGRERDERSRRYTAERGLEIERLENRFEKVIASLRESILDKLEEQKNSLRNDMREFNGRLTTAERDVAVLKDRE